MPRLEQALYTYLVADPGVSGLVLARVYPDRLPEGVTLPAVSHRRVSARRLNTYDPFPEENAWVTARIQFDCWGREALEAIEVGEAIMLALSGYSGDMGGDVTVGSAFGLDEVDLYEAATKKFRRVVDFSISYEDNLAPTPGVDGLAQPEAVGGSAGV